MPYVSRQIQTINGHQRTHYTAQGQMVFDEISLNAIAKLRRDCSGWWHYPPTVQNKKQTNRNNLLVACPPQTKMCSIKLIFWQPLRMRNIEGLRAPFLLFSFNHFYLCEWFWGYFMSNPFKAWSQKWLITISWKIWKVQKMQIRVWGRLAPKEKG